LAVTVTLDLFSGRPNPEWSLSTDDARSLVDALRHLPISTDKPPTPPGLGYRGLVVRISGDQGDAEYRLFAGMAVSANRRLIDDGRALERGLLQSATTEIDPGLLKQLLDQF